MIRAITDLREGPESRQTVEYRKVVRHNGRIVSNEKTTVRPPVKPPVFNTLDLFAYMWSIARPEWRSGLDARINFTDPR